MKKYLTFIFLLLSKFTYAQEIESKVCVLLEYNFDGVINLYNNSMKDSALIIQNDLENEDYIYFGLIAKNDSMYYVEARFEIMGYIGKGWIDRNNTLKIYSRNYSQKLILYAEPNSISNVQCVIDKYVPLLFDVLDFNGQWLKVKLKYNETIYEGWLSPEMQCCNHYSTCN